MPFLKLCVFWTVRFRLEVTSYCNEWKSNATSDKMMRFVHQLLEYIRDRCECIFPSTHIHQQRFMCFDSSPNHVTFGASIVAYQTWNTTQLVSFLEDWKSSHRTVAIHGETLVVSGEECPVLILTFEESQFCPVEMSSPQAPPSTQTPGYTAPSFTLIGGVSAGTALLFMIVILVVLYMCKKWKR